jgi:hypothetical protein
VVIPLSFQKISGKFIFSYPLGVFSFLGSILGIPLVILFIKATGKETSLKRREERFTRSRLESIMRNYITTLLENYGPEYSRLIEEVFLFRVGMLCSYLKKRGREIGRLGRETYAVYERFATALKNTIEETLARYPKIGERSTLLHYIPKCDDAHIARMMEYFARESEAYVRYGRLSRKSLKRLKALLK